VADQRDSWKEGLVARVVDPAEEDLVDRVVDPAVRAVALVPADSPAGVAEDFPVGLVDSLAVRGDFPVGLVDPEGEADPVTVRCLIPLRWPN
jgi:hypothetical protein